jgi:hypothetical protein
MRSFPEQAILKLPTGPRLVLAVIALIALLGAHGCKSKAEEDPTAAAEEQAKRDPSYLEASAVASKFADEFWNDRFIRCGSTSEGDERWFSVEESTVARRYLEVINLRTVTVATPRLSSASSLNRVWTAISSLSAKASRWCQDDKCNDYEGGLIGVEQFNLYGMSIIIRNGVATSERPPLMSYYKPTCEEIRGQPIWRMPYE